LSIVQDMYAPSALALAPLSRTGHVYDTQTISLHFYAVSETSNRKVKRSKLVDSVLYVEICNWGGSTVTFRVQNLKLQNQNLKFWFGKSVPNSPPYLTSPSPKFPNWRSSLSTSPSHVLCIILHSLLNSPTSKFDNTPPGWHLYKQ
jgi:hypothetical protein